MLISCVAYQDGKRIADIEPGEIHRYVAMPGCFVWVALLERDPQVLEQMQAQFGLHPLAVEDASVGHQRPKIHDYGDSLFAVMHLLERREGALCIGEIDVFVGRNYVLSIRTGAEQGFREVRARCEREPELLKNGSGYVLYALMDAVVDRYFPVLDSVETQLEAVEERIFSDTSARETVESLYALKQELVTIRHAVAPLHDGLKALHGARVPTVCAGMSDYFRDISEHLQRLSQTVESVRDTISTAISVNLSMIGLQENATMKRLAAYGALIAMPTLIAGIYGMNFHYMPELNWEYGYVLAAGIMIAVDLYLWYRLRKAKWL